MSKIARNGLYIRAVLYGQSSVSVPKIVKSGLRDANLRHDLFEVSVQRVVLNMLTIWISKDKSVIGINIVLFLFFFDPFEHLDHLVRRDERALLIVFQRSKLKDSFSIYGSGLYELSVNPYCVLLEVDAIPRQSY